MTNECPATSPSDEPCIGRAFYHEVHCSRSGTTWRDWAGKTKGVPAIPDVPEQVELPSEPGAILDGLLWAMCGNTDGELIDGNSEIPAGEMYRLAVEFLKPVLAALVPAGSEREAALAAIKENAGYDESTGVCAGVEGWNQERREGYETATAEAIEAIEAILALVPEAEEEKATLPKDEPEDDRWYCARCGKVSSMYGHNGHCEPNPELVSKNIGKKL